VDSVRGVVEPERSPVHPRTADIITTKMVLMTTRPILGTIVSFP